ncbi:GrpB family protein [Virgibacillus pantothenticus]|uniref:Glutamate-rich protein GrpB n=1 Tax=Virgibacillus pantothenticus TaxID=1473 RepID=A0A0L0QTA7_VIRPA|nr:GrpB family protein [Virgibacillus pantothenticus]KNE21816.1 glutamate-rich protein GrpB [Virgibacillus pantothenticus]MBU8568025.1 GrpB family protein [Virgibacillus pantothenticus]MBU8601719.1 GrpB family protein [Virgibacillus pantothenticus]MBU8636093.1 GrpB family protein [Virgibacillus pantothenticus]MBU8643556.1 GrpB family protein [Virgibacillus pantothenticus]
MRKVIVTPYQSKWQNLFMQEAKNIAAIFKTELVAMHHIGSTAVPGLAAKPIIDIMPVVSSIEKVDQYIEEMENLGYVALGENGIEGRRYFNKGGNERTHHVHVFEEGDDHIKRHLAFKDYLIAHPSIAKKYGDLKTALAIKYPKQIEAYISEKNDFVKEVEQEALTWYRLKEA